MRSKPGTLITRLLPERGASAWWLIAPATQGTELPGGWVISDMSPIQRGAAVLLIQHPEDGELEVHLCRHDGNPKGPVHTVLFDLIVMDGGRGRRRTDPTVGQALTELGYYIQANELLDDSAIEVAADLLVHDDRVQMFGPDGL